MIERTDFLDLLWKWKDHDLIKVVTGVRRCGKSTVLDAFAERLVRSGVPKSRILRMDFESEEFDTIRSVEAARGWLAAHRPKGKRAYVFLDEVQRIPEFERLVDGLYRRKDADVYVTGSNATLLSGELATYLSGRYVELLLQPLSYREFAEGTGRDPRANATWSDYLRRGGFPYLTALGDDPKLAEGYLEGVYNTVLVKDVLRRTGAADPAQVSRVAQFLFDNVGNVTSIQKIADTLTSAGSKCAYHTVESYVDALCKAYLFRKAERFDAKGRELLKTGYKFYAVDTGLRDVLVRHRPGDEGHLLENVIFNELVRRHASVSVGKCDTLEIDFVVRAGGLTSYVQVAETLRGPGVLKRELEPLKRLRDNYPKTVVTLDAAPPSSEDGITCVNAIDFLLGRG